MGHQGLSQWAPIRVSDLARRMYLHPTTVVGILDRLESRDLVFRTRSTTDRRVVEVDLTAQGRQLVEKAPEVAQGLLVKGLEVMPDDRLSYIAGGLHDLVSILGAQDMPPRLLLSPEINIPKSPRGAGGRKQQ